MKFGYFDDEQREYVITRPDTPLPWINYLGSEDFFGIISNTGGGYTFYKDARLRRLTRYRYNNAPLDAGGRYLYLRDESANPASSWSPTWQPARSQLDEYECRHGMGYTTIQSTQDGISAQTRYFHPPWREPGNLGARAYQPAPPGSKHIHLRSSRVLPVGCAGRCDQLPAQLFGR